MRIEDAAIIAAGYPGSRAYWSHVESMVAKLDALNRALMFGLDGVESRGRRAIKPLVKDPTAAQAMAHQSAIKAYEQMQAERDATTDELGAALVLLEGVRAAMGHKYADVLEMRYIDRFKWSQIAFELGISRTEAFRVLNVAHDWIDSYGWHALIGGKND